MSATSTVTKKLVNTPETCVDDNLRGLVSLYPQLHLHPKHRVVTLHNENNSGKVAVIGGGGSGHEPFAAGFVGNGMLDGAVAGGVFASPPTAHVHYAITKLNKHHTGGVLVIIGNYTGDRLNFGKAIEKAKISGIKVEGVIVGEDVASSDNKTGGRGMIGEVILYKICGAMSAEGRSLEDIRDAALEATKHLATLGVCLRACSLPGQPPLFEIEPEEMELGAGVHGEAGIRKMKLGAAEEVVSVILDHILEHLKLKAGDRVVAMLNNLGGTSIMEMNILSGETKKYLETKSVHVERVYAGHLKSSLEMHGVQICLLHLCERRGEEWLRLLDAASDAPAWPATALALPATRAARGDDQDVVDANAAGRKTALGPKLSKRQQELARKCLEEASKVLIENEELLNRLDSGCGDGDCGITLKNLAQAVLKYIKSAPLEYPSSILWDLSEIAENDMGGTSGGIYGLGLSAASQAFSIAETAEPAAWASAWKSAVEAIMKYGGAEPGDRTMVDTINPAVVTFERCLHECDWSITIEKTIEAAEEGAKSTASMVAKAGRAAYVAAARAHAQDAGARGAALALGAALAALGGD